LAQWNAVSGVRRAKTLDGKRRSAYRTRIRESAWLANYTEALGRIPGSAFLRGENDRGWTANVDWFLRECTVARILEGQYDDRRPNGGERISDLADPPRYPTDDELREWGYYFPPNGADPKGGEG
jgi:hypothetical protein